MLGKAGVQMKILVLNSGSSSLKYQLFDTNHEIVLAKGLVDKIGLAGSSVVHEIHEEYKDEVKVEYRDEKKVIQLSIPSHEDAIGLVIEVLTHPKDGVIKDMNEIDAVGHRIVHGGDTFKESVELTEDVLEQLEQLNELAPLHNPPALAGIRACKEVMPDVPNVGVFDTSFHQTMPESSYIYSIGYDMYEKYKIRRYGFHGTSHRFVWEKVVDMLDMPIDCTKVITCHLGNGCSIAAIEGGKVVDTSMGFTPLEGLVMGTRSGDLDPSIIPYLMEKEGWDIHQITAYLNKGSGLLGVSGVSSDLRDIYDAVDIGDERAKLAVEIAYKRVVKYIGAYVAEMNGVDAIVFTAGIGENDVNFRRVVCEHLGYLGVEVDLALNNCRSELREITTKDSKVKVFIVPTNEELLIAKDTREIILRKNARNRRRK